MMIEHRPIVRRWRMIEDIWLHKLVEKPQSGTSRRVQDFRGS